MALNLNSSLNINSGSLNITQTPRTSVIYDSGLIFSASVTDVSTIASGLFSITSSIVTLNPADTTFDRIDAIVAEFSGSSGKRITNISGTASADPQFPALDYDLQIPLKYIRVNANATTPLSAGTNPQDQTTGTDFENILLYNENLGVAGGEWDAGGATSYSNWYSIPGNNLASTEQAYTGSVSIKNSMARVLSSTDVANRLVFDFLREQGNTIISSRLAGFSFYIKLTTDLSTSEPFLSAQFRENSPKNQNNQKTNGNYFTFPTFEDLGINTRNTTDWQYVTLPVTDFSTNINGQANENWVITSFQMGTGVRARNIPNNSFVYVDFVQMHLGSLPTTDPNNSGGSTGNQSSTTGTGVYKQGDTSFSIIPTNALSCVTNDFSTIGGGQNNTITASQYSYIGAGQNNILASGSNYSSIIGGSNNTSSYENSFIIGSNLTSDKACHTFMNNLDVEGTVSASIFSGSFVGDGSNLTGISGSGSTNTGSLLTTASVSSNTITFTKGDNSTFDIIVNTGSGGGSGSDSDWFDGTTYISSSVEIRVDGTISGSSGAVIGPGHTNNGINSVIIGGQNSNISSSVACAAIVGGNANCVAFDRGTIVGGNSNCVKATSGTIIGGFTNINNSGVGVIIGGQSNCLQTRNGEDASAYSSIGGGLFNCILTPSNDPSNNCAIFSQTIGGGTSNIIETATCNGCYNSIFAGSGNVITGSLSADVGCSFIGGGRLNKISGSSSNSAILGGCGNIITSNESTFIVGSDICSNAACTTFVNNLTAKGTSGGNSVIIFDNLPTSDPGVTGQLWNDGGVLKIS